MRRDEILYQTLFMRARTNTRETALKQWGSLAAHGLRQAYVTENYYQKVPNLDARMRGCCNRSPNMLYSSARIVV